MELICRDGCKIEGFIEAVASEYSGYTHGKCKQPFDVRATECPDCGEKLNWNDAIEKRLQKHDELYG
jgi:transcription initiation factor IIE alpha subunit